MGSAKKVVAPSIGIEVIYISGENENGIAVSAIKGEPGFDSSLVTTKVMWEGIPLQGCLRADSKHGYADCYIFDENGKLVLDGYGTLRQARVYGEIVIHNTAKSLMPPSEYTSVFQKVADQIKNFSKGKSKIKEAQKKEVQEKWKAIPWKPAWDGASLTVGAPPSVEKANNHIPAPKGPIEVKMKHFGDTGTTAMSMKFEGPFIMGEGDCFVVPASNNKWGHSHEKVTVKMCGGGFIASEDNIITFSVEKQDDEEVYYIEPYDVNITNSTKVKKKADPVVTKLEDQLAKHIAPPSMIIGMHMDANMDHSQTLTIKFLGPFCMKQGQFFVVNGMAVKLTKGDFAIAADVIGEIKTYDFLLAEHMFLFSADSVWSGPSPAAKKPMKLDLNVGSSIKKPNKNPRGLM